MVTALHIESACAPTVIEFSVDGHLLRAIRIELIAQYGEALSGLSDRVRTVLIATARDVLGDTHPPVLASDITVVFTDVTPGDPRS